MFQFKTCRRLRERILLMRISRQKQRLFVAGLMLVSGTAFAASAPVDPANPQTAFSPTITVSETNAANNPPVQQEPAGLLTQLQQANSPLSAASLNPASPDVIHADPALLIADTKRQQIFLVYNDHDDVKRVETYSFKGNGEVKKIRTDFINTQTNDVFAIHIEKYKHDLLREWKIWLEFGDPAEDQFLLIGLRKFNKKTGVVDSWLSFDRDATGAVKRIFEKYPDGTNKTVLTFDAAKHLLNKQTLPFDPDSGIPVLGPVTGEDRIRTDYTVDLGPVPVDLPKNNELKQKPLPNYKKALK